MKNLIFLVFLIFYIDCQLSSPKNVKFIDCVKKDLVSCEFLKLELNYNKMKKSKCPNCERYFRCQGNYEAVLNCKNGTLTKRRETWH